MSVEYTKNLVGKPIVKFNCPNCQLRLSAMLSEAGIQDKCPECGQRFKVPGQQKLQQVEEQRRLSQETKAAAKKKKSDDAKAQKAKTPRDGSRPKHESSGMVPGQDPEKPPEVDDRWLVDPQVADELPPSKTSRSSESGASESGASESGSSESGASDSGASDSKTLGVSRSGSSDPVAGPTLPGPVTPRSITAETAKHQENVSHDGRPTRAAHRASRAWWKDSVRFESVSSSRYPALMAFRNLLVLLWWIMMLCSLVGLIGYPFVLMYRGYTNHSTASRFYDRELEKYDNAMIEDLLNQASLGLSVKDASRLNQELGRFQYSDFPMWNRIKANKPASPEEVEVVAKAWRDWTGARKEQINQERPSLVMAFLMVLCLILLYWVAQIVIIIVYSILILVPPECIKLAIDIERGVRGGKTPVPD